MSSNKINVFGGTLLSRVNSLWSSMCQLATLKIATLRGNGAFSGRVVFLQIFKNQIFAKINLPNKEIHKYKKMGRPWLHYDIKSFNEAAEKLIKYKLNDDEFKYNKISGGGEFLVHRLINDNSHIKKGTFANNGFSRNSYHSSQSEATFRSQNECKSSKCKSAKVKSSNRLPLLSDDTSDHSWLNKRTITDHEDPIYGITLWLSGFPDIIKRDTHINGKTLESSPFKNFTLSKPFKEYQHYSAQTHGKIINYPILHIPIYQKTIIVKDTNDENPDQIFHLFYLDCNRFVSKYTFGSRNKIWKRLEGLHDIYTKHGVQPKFDNLEDLISYYRVGGEGENYLKYYMYDYLEYTYSELGRSRKQPFRLDKSKNNVTWLNLGYNELQVKLRYIFRNNKDDYPIEHAPYFHGDLKKVETIPFMMPAIYSPGSHLVRYTECMEKIIISKGDKKGTELVAMYTLCVKCSSLKEEDKKRNYETDSDFDENFLTHVEIKEVTIYRVEEDFEDDITTMPDAEMPKYCYLYENGQPSRACDDLNILLYGGWQPKSLDKIRKIWQINNYEVDSFLNLNKEHETRKAKLPIKKIIKDNKFSIYHSFDDNMSIINKEFDIINYSQLLLNHFREGSKNHNGQRFERPNVELNPDPKLKGKDSWHKHKEVSKHKFYSTKAAEFESCKKKNRYEAVVPMCTLAYDHSRPLLHFNYMNKLMGHIKKENRKEIFPDDSSEYINANHIGRYGDQLRGRTYIATQGPLVNSRSPATGKLKPDTHTDFWRMVIDNKVKIIVSTSKLEEKGKEKVGKYYPYWDDHDPEKRTMEIFLDKNKRKNILTIVCETEIKVDNRGIPLDYIQGLDPIDKTTDKGCYIKRKFKLTSKQKECLPASERIYTFHDKVHFDEDDEELSWYVYQFEYLRWADFGIASGVSELLMFREEIDIFAENWRKYEECEARLLEIENKKIEYDNSFWKGKMGSWFSDKNQLPEHEVLLRDLESQPSLKPFREKPELFLYSRDKIGEPIDTGTFENYQTETFKTLKNNTKDGSKAHSGPIIVHCSAGVGRTGTFITVDMILDQIKWNGIYSSVNVFKTVLFLRRARKMAVQSNAQYESIYEILAWKSKEENQRMEGLLEEHEKNKKDWEKL